MICVIAKRGLRTAWSTFATSLILSAACFTMLGGVAQGNTLRVAVAGLPTDKSNPHRALIDYAGTWSAILDPLTLVTDDGELLPWLAVNWTQENPETWVFTLRDGVTFSNGRAFDATAVEGTLNYLSSKSGRADSVGRTLAFIRGVEILDPLNIRISTRGPRPTLPYDLQLLRIPEPDTWQTSAPADTETTLVGTGPFSIDRWTADQVALRAVDTSWRAPKAQRLVLQAAPDSTSRLSAFLTGQFDVMAGVAPDMVPQIMSADGSISQGAVPGAMAIIFNSVKDKRFEDVRLRQALNLAVNKTAIIEILFAGLTRPASQPAHRMVLGYNDKIAPYPYDPDRARALLMEAGYPDGLSFTLEASNESSQNLNAYQQVAIDLDRVGVNMTIQTIPRPQYLEKFQGGAWDGSAFPLGFFSASLDGLSIIEGNSCLRPNPWYCDEGAMPLIKSALAETSLEPRIQSTRRLMAYSHQTASALFLYEAVTLTALQRGITGYMAHGPFVLYEHVGRAN